MYFFPDSICESQWRHLLHSFSDPVCVHMRRAWSKRLAGVPLRRVGIYKQRPNSKGLVEWEHMCAMGWSGYFLSIPPSFFSKSGFEPLSSCYMNCLSRQETMSFFRFIGLIKLILSTSVSFISHLSPNPGTQNGFLKKDGTETFIGLYRS